ncbi:SAM-dependent methyltransferase [Nocardia nova]|uniref:SAM-dependent methyltransferase n=1 Tax=Nocardia nova TaxID=37330 RepID=UPI0033DEEC03
MEFHPEVAHTARVYDWWLGGNDNYEADRIAGARSEEVFPTVRTTARKNRDFMLRSAKYLAAQGVRQFLDIGTGIPTEPNLHQAVQAVAPEARVVYVDSDPMVLTHARALMSGTPQGRTAYIEADVRQPDSILSAPELVATLDLSQPVAVSLIAVMHFVEDRHDPYGVVGRIVDAVPSGSYLVMTHATPDLGPEMAEVQRVYHESGMPGQIRTRAEFARFFDGMEWVEPGLTTPHRWRPDGVEPPASMDARVQFYAGVARKP